MPKTIQFKKITKEIQQKVENLTISQLRKICHIIWEEEGDFFSEESCQDEGLKQIIIGALCVNAPRSELDKSTLLDHWLNKISK